ncbi:hypothetical protein GCM10009744_28720 [Kribbella alba]|uniref:Uncharacterized protein n=1 Tax=Kribbella alba TaxID=190197 RepID=A0ABN2FA96_9ACTN
MMPFGAGGGAVEGWVGAALTKSGDLGQVVGALNMLFRVRGPCLVFKVAASGFGKALVDKGIADRRICPGKAGPGGPRTEGRPGSSYLL